LSRGVYGVLRRSVPNISGFLRGLVYDALGRLPVVYEMEEQRLELEIAFLADELRKVHSWQCLLLKHGSYAEAYLEKLKGGLLQDRKPHFLPEPPPFIKQQELFVVEDIVKYREKLAAQLTEKLSRIMKLKHSQSRGHMTNKAAKQRLAAKEKKQDA